MIKLDLTLDWSGYALPEPALDRATSTDAGEAKASLGSSPGKPVQTLG